VFEGGALNTVRSYIAGVGECQYSAIAFGGLTNGGTTCTEEYDGSTWSASGALNTARRNFAGAGTKNVALAFGGYTSGLTTATEEFTRPFIPPFNTSFPSAWSTGGSLSSASRVGGGAGLANAALNFGGLNPATTNGNIMVQLGQQVVI
jgi:hypothetical protein